MIFRNKVLAPKLSPADIAHGLSANRCFGVLTGMPLRESVKLKKPPEFDYAGTMSVVGGCKFTYAGDFAQYLPHGVRFRGEPITYEYSYNIQFVKSTEHQVWELTSGVVVVVRPDINMTNMHKCHYEVQLNSAGKIQLLPMDAWITNAYVGHDHTDREVLPNPKNTT